MPKIESILILGYPQCGEQDTLAPWEMFKSLAWKMSQANQTLSVELGTFEGGRVTMQMGAVIDVERKVTPQTRQHFEQLLARLANANDGRLGQVSALNYQDHPCGGCPRRRLQPDAQLLRARWPGPRLRPLR